MAATGPTNEERLREAGVIVADQLEPTQAAMVEGLTPEEVDVIVAVKKRIDETDRVLGWTPASGDRPPSIHVFMPP
jgi:hypothetical protein